MKPVICSLVVMAAVACADFPAHAQGTKADYERAASLPRRFSDKVYRDGVTPHWLVGGRAFWYRIATGPGRFEFVLVDTVRGTRQPAFDHQRLAKTLVAAGVAGANAENLPIGRLHIEPDEQSLSLAVGDKVWKCRLDDYRLEESPDAAGLVAVDAPRRARGGQAAETWVTFFNRTAAAVELFWVPSAGERRSYGQLAAGQRRRQHTFTGHRWLVVDSQGKTLADFDAQRDDTIVDIDGKGAPPRRGFWNYLAREPPGVSPDDRWQASIKDYNVQLRDRKSDETLMLSTDGTQSDPYGGEFHWSHDSQKLVALRVRQGDQRKVYLIESSPRYDTQPKLHSYEYLKPGDRIPQPRPCLFDIATRRAMPIEETLFSNPWSVSDVRWDADSSRFTFLYNQRGHQVLRILAVDAGTGAVRPVVDETSAKFIDYAGKHFVRYLDDTNEIIWMSERDGWNHLYLYDGHSGQVKSQITKGPWVVRRVEHVDVKARQVWFRAGGIRAEQDPYYVHHCRVNFDGSGLVILTAGDGTHEIEVSPDGQTLIDTYSRVDLAPITELRSVADGSLVCGLERADASDLALEFWRAPQRFTAKGRDGQTDIFGVIYRPTNFDPARKYAVIEEIYAGPQSAYVPKGFRSLHSGQSLAELGFIVVQIDGMGTSHRSKAFHDVCWKNLGDAGFPDRIAWIQAAAQQEPAMDLSRVGIYGGSAGGQNSTRALLAHGEFYKVAVSDCGCHDNRMDKIWWNELWMGWPVGPHYEEQSNVTQAHRLAGKLLLVVGELDRNVDPASTMQVVDALVKAEKDFDLLVVPGAGHGAAESSYGRRRRADFFVRHLLGIEPRCVP